MPTGVNRPTFRNLRSLGTDALIISLENYEKERQGRRQKAKEGVEFKRVQGSLLVGERARGVGVNGGAWVGNFGGRGPVDSRLRRRIRMQPKVEGKHLKNCHDKRSN